MRLSFSLNAFSRFYSAFYKMCLRDLYFDTRSVAIFILDILSASYPVGRLVG